MTHSGTLLTHSLLFETVSRLSLFTSLPVLLEVYKYVKVRVFFFTGSLTAKFQHCTPGSGISHPFPLTSFWRDSLFCSLAFFLLLVSCLSNCTQESALCAIKFSSYSPFTQHCIHFFWSTQELFLHLLFSVTNLVVLSVCNSQTTCPYSFTFISNSWGPVNYGQFRAWHEQWAHFFASQLTLGNDIERTWKILQEHIFSTVLFVLIDIE